MHIRRQRPLQHNNMEREEKATTKNEIDNPGQLFAQGFKLACCVVRVGVQARTTCSHGDRYDADIIIRRQWTRPRLEAALA